MKNNKLPSMEEVYAALGKKAEDYEQIAPEEIMPEIQDTNSVSKMESILRGAGDSATFGFSDEIAGAIKSPLGAAQALVGIESDEAAEYEFAKRKWEEENETAKEENPWSYGAGGLAGAFIPGIGLTKGIAAGAKALAPGSNIAQKLIAGAKLAETAPGAGNALSNAALLGMTEGAIGAGVANIGEADRLSDVTVLGTAESTAKGALLGAAIPGAVGAVKGVGSLIPGNWTKTASDTFDVTRKGINITDAKDMAAVEQELKKSGSDLISSILEQGKQISNKYKPVLKEMGDIDEASRATLISKVDPERFGLLTQKTQLEDDILNFKKLKADSTDASARAQLSRVIEKATAELGLVKNKLGKDELGSVKDSLFEKIGNAKNYDDLYGKKINIDNEISALERAGGRTSVGELDTLKKFREEALGLMEEKSAGKIPELNKEFSEFKSLTKQSLGQGLTPEDLANESIVDQLIASSKLSADTVPLQSKVIDKFLVDLENSFKNPGQRGYKQFQTQIQQLDALAEKYPAFRPKIDKILEDTKTIGVFRDYKQPNGVWAGVKSAAMVAPKIAGEVANAFDNSLLVKGATQNAKAVINKITPDLRTRFANNPTILSIFDRISNPETPISVKNAYVNTLINNPMTRQFFVEEEK